jgi:hypothetical protein
LLRRRITVGDAPHEGLSGVEWVKDFWRCGVVAADAADLVRAGTLDGAAVTWLPNRSSLHYLADPFGFWSQSRLHVFAESFSYRDGVGHIDVLTLDHDFTPIEQRTVLREPWHLSYPFVLEAEGAIWMLPEAHQSGALWLYRAVEFPHRWRRERQIVLDHVPLDATLLQQDDMWWLFYAPADPPSARLTTLCAAFAPRIEGPWTPHPSNPILSDAHGARPGGTPLVVDGVMHLPLQRCTGSYGSGLRILRLDQLSPARVVASFVGDLNAPAGAAPFTDGCHTFSAAGAITLIDVKRRRFSPGALAAWPARRRRHRQMRDQFP